MECNKKNNIRNCNCSYEGCLRKGICCECVAYHRSKRQLPACFFPEDIEKEYDRSVKNFIEIFEHAQKSYYDF